MPINIDSIVIHRINKEQYGINNVSLQLANELLPVENSIDLVNKLNSTFNTGTSKQYGSFEANTDIYPFSSMLRQYYNNELSFINFTQRATEFLKNKIAIINLATGGDILFVRYTNQETDYLIVLMLKIKKSFSVTDRLKIQPVTHINDDEIDAIARINLGLWNSNNSEKYISFTRKGKNNNISIYFTEFIGCIEFTKSKEMTKNLVDLIKNYAKNNINSDMRDQTIQDIYSFLKERQKQDGEIDIEQLDRRIDPTGLRRFIEFMNNNDIQLSNNFAADLAILNRLSRFTYKSNGFNVSFDKDFLREHVIYNSATNTLQINNLDNNFKTQYNNFKNE